MALAEESSGPAATSAAFAPLRNDAPPTTGLSGDVGAEVSAAEAEAPHALRQRRRRRQATTKNSPNLRPAPSPSTPSLFARHASWVRANAGAVAALESALSSATWLMPDRFSEGEAPALEGAHALLGLLSLYHEALLSVDESSSSSPRGLFGALGWPLWLAAIQQVEVLVEIAATRAETSGKISSRYTPLAWLEGVKAAARLLLLLRRGGGRILLDGGASLPLFGGGGNSGDPPSSSTSLSASSRRAARTAAVFAAFSEFREKRGLPPVPQYQRAAAALKGGSAASAAAHAASAAAAAAVVPPASSSASTSSSSSKIRLWWDSPLPLLFRSPLPSPRRSEIEPADEEEQGEEERGEAEERRRRNANDFGLEPGNENTAMSLLHSADAAADAAAWRGAHAMALGEILFVARPLTYVLALRRSSSRSSLNSSSSSKWTPWLISSSSSKWTPWLISLSVDALSAYLLRRGASRCRVAAGEASRRLAAAGAPAAARAAAASAEALDWSRDEAAELARRRALLALYLLRKPAFDAGVGPVLDGGERVLSRVPLLGLLVSRGADIVRGVTGYYTYTSGS